MRELNIFELVLEVLPDLEKHFRNVEYQLKGNRLYILDKNHLSIHTIINLWDECSGCVLVRAMGSSTLTHILTWIILERINVSLVRLHDNYVNDWLDRMYGSDDVNVTHTILCINTTCRDRCLELLSREVEKLERLEEIYDDCDRSCREKYVPLFRKYRELLMEGRESESWRVFSEAFSEYLKRQGEIIKCRDECYREKCRDIKLRIINHLK